METTKKTMLIAIAMLLIATNAFAQTPSRRLLTPQNSAVTLIDHQPQMAFATRSIDVLELRNNVTGFAHPEQIRRSTYDPNVVLLSTFYADILDGKHLVVVVKLDERPFVLTVYVARRLARER